MSRRKRRRQALVGRMVSVSRPRYGPGGATKNPDGSLRPFYLSRQFKYLGDDRFELTIANSADPLWEGCPWPGSTCAATCSGRVITQSHPARKKVGFRRRRGLSGSLRLRNPFAEPPQQGSRSAGYAKWEVNVPQKIFGKSFAALRTRGGTQLHGVRPGVYQAATCSSGVHANIDGRGLRQGR